MGVVVLGDANVDLEITLPVAELVGVHTNPDPVLFGGGSAANTAAALAKLGVECGFVGTVGQDGHGAFAIDSLRSSGVDTSLMVQVAGEPTVQVIVVVQPDGDRLIYVWPPAGGAHRFLTKKQACSAIAGAEWVHVTGLCLRVSPAAESILAAMEAAGAAGIPVSLDLNLRLENWGWDDGFRSVVERAVEHAEFVMGAAFDEIIPFAGVEDPREAATILAGDNRTVIARRGAGGAFAAHEGTVTSSPGFHVDVVNTVGAGDAFNAGFIASRLRGASLETALQTGNAVAALTIGQPGARTSPDRLTLEAFLADRLP